ncbi:unnamed protein product [Closterium sp. NIES-64]|nr:unnamed protein product [Closterium sp. NIES-64]
MRLLLSLATAKASTLHGSTPTSTTAAATPTAAAAAAPTSTTATDAPTPATTPTSTPTPSASSTATTAAPAVPSTTLAPLALAAAAPPTKSRRSPDLFGANEVDSISRSNRGQKGNGGTPLKERGARVAARSFYIDYASVSCSEALLEQVDSELVAAAVAVGQGGAAWKGGAARLGDAAQLGGAARQGGRLLGAGAGQGRNWRLG